MKKIKIFRFILFVLIVAWYVMVFSLSNQSGEASSGLSRRLVELFIKQEEIVDKVEPYVRKLAHLSEYAFGGMLFTALFSTYNWSDKRILTTSILLGPWYAGLDEFHQLMVSERSGNIVDVYIDSLGVALGTVIFMIMLKIVKLLKSKKERKGEVHD